jgi:hypothetical protein
MSSVQVRDRRDHPPPDGLAISDGDFTDIEIIGQRLRGVTNQNRGVLSEREQRVLPEDLAPEFEVASRDTLPDRKDRRHPRRHRNLRRDASRQAAGVDRCELIATAEVAAISYPAWRTGRDVACAIRRRWAVK